MPRWRAAVVAGLLVAGCPARDGERHKPIDVELDAGRPVRAGVRVPLPDGWTARVGSDQSLRAGPQDRVVLRIDQRAGERREFPTARELEEGLRASVPGAHVERISAVEEADFVIVQLKLYPPRDGGARPVPIALGARRMGDDLFLCATEPGASEDEVEKAALACGQLAQAAPKP